MKRLTVYLSEDVKQTLYKEVFNHNLANKLLEKLSKDLTAKSVNVFERDENRGFKHTKINLEYLELKAKWTIFEDVGNDENRIMLITDIKEIELHENFTEWVVSEFTDNVWNY